MNNSSVGNKKYFIPLYYDSSAVSLVLFLRTRDEAGSAIKEMILELETQRKSRVKVLHISVYSGEIVKRLRTDNAKEFLSGIFQKWMQSRGITHELTSAYSPESNGKAERLNRILLDMGRIMLHAAYHVPNYTCLWVEAVNCANYLRNRLYSSPCSDTSKTPYDQET